MNKGFFVQKLSAQWRSESPYSSDRSLRLAPLYKSGFTLAELLVYLVVMTLVLTALTSLSVNVYRMYGMTIAEVRADRAASTLMQVLGSEMRSGVSINQAESVFNTAFGSLTLNVQQGETALERVFSVEEGRVYMTEDGDEYALTPEDVDVTKFLFTQIVTPVSYAVRYEIDVTYERNDVLVTKTYPGVIILRHSYE